MTTQLISEHMELADRYGNEADRISRRGDIDSRLKTSLYAYFSERSHIEKNAARLRAAEIGIDFNDLIVEHIRTKLALKGSEVDQSCLVLDTL